MRPRVYPAEAITCRAKARPADSTCFNEATGRTPPRKPPANEHVVDGEGRVAGAALRLAGGDPRTAAARLRVQAADACEAAALALRGGAGDERARQCMDQAGRCLRAADGLTRGEWT